MPTILHLEDDPANRLLVRKLLTAVGFDVVDAVDGLDGFRKACDLKPSLVLVDIAIPGLDGYEVTLRLRAEPSLRNVPIVAITAEGNRDTSLAVGCDGFLQKPIAARTFAATIQGYLGGHRERAGPRATDEHLRAQSQRIVAHLEEKIAELSDANSRLRELDQARREFYRNISHELATPMTPIVGYVRLLSDGELGALSPPQLKAVRAVDECAQRLRGLIDNLLDVTALETGRMRFLVREYDFADTVRKSLRRWEGAFAERKLQIVTEVPEALSGQGDAARLGRAVNEMLDNAGKFTPEGGAVGIRLRRASKSEFELCIADTGPGVPSSAAHRLFEPFYQADGSVTRAHGGAGVGLAIVRGVAEGHGGDVRVKSPADEQIGGLRFAGAAFYLTIAEQAPVDREYSRVVRPADPGGARGVYLDWNATTPPHPEVLVAMREVAAVAWGNPSSVHATGRRASAVVEVARETLAETVRRCAARRRAHVGRNGGQQPRPSVRFLAHHEQTRASVRSPRR